MTRAARKALAAGEMVLLVLLVAALLVTLIPVAFFILLGAGTLWAVMKAVGLLEDVR